MTTLRSTVLAVLLATAPAGSALAQAPPRSADNPCYRARPAPECSVFFTTNAGGYIGGTGRESRLRAIVDWGVMVNASPRHAIGGSWFVTLDEDDFTTGPVIRYRHWFGVGVRPEYLRRTRFDCGPSTCTEYTASSTRVYGGIEFGWFPGLALSVGGGMAAGLALIALSGID